MTRNTILALALLSFTALAHGQQIPTPAAAEWWRLTSALSSDAMQGRDTGSEAYEKAAIYVADQFKADGLKPAGDNGTWFQRVPMHQVDLDVAHSSVELIGKNKPEAPDVLRLLYETTLVPRVGLPSLTEAPLVFIGYGAALPSVDLHGKIAVFFNNAPAELLGPKRAALAGERSLMLTQAGVAGIVSIDNPAAIEPTHWPAAYARSVSLASGSGQTAPANAITLRISAEAAARLFAGSDADPAKILADAEKGLPLPTLALARKMRITIRTTEKDISAPNILGTLPGSDAKLAPEFVVVSAHLDGYGFGTPVLGDNLYNGALDDAAYVATLLELAENLKAHPSEIPARSILFCIFTGEEKGLLGSVFFTQHPTVPVPQMVTNFNLDQLRPIFPLTILTMEGVADSTLGKTSRAVGQQFGIELRPDLETERNLFRRADNYSFVRIGVPIASFIFGYNPGTPEERIYRDWYARRYHKPQDDLATPIDWTAAVKFNNFYRALVLKVANDPVRPAWIRSSVYAPKDNL